MTSWKHGCVVIVAVLLAFIRLRRNEAKNTGTRMTRVGWVNTDFFLLRRKLDINTLLIL
jgi:hypothetical protein